MDVAVLYTTVDDPCAAVIDGCCGWLPAGHFVVLVNPSAQKEPVHA